MLSFKNACKSIVIFKLVFKATLKGVVIDMRFTINICNKKRCSNRTRAGFRFCYAKDCGGKKQEESEEE